MQLGAFSVSLAVEDLEASRAFYASLGFEAMGGDAGSGWLIMKSGDTIVGLFSGMFGDNMLTFNPGWDQNAQTLAEFDDVRELHARLASLGIATESETGLDGDGPASFTVSDPDGNRILIDQHVPKPK